MGVRKKPELENFTRCSCGSLKHRGALEKDHLSTDVMSPLRIHFPVCFNRENTWIRCLKAPFVLDKNNCKLIAEGAARGGTPYANDITDEVKLHQFLCDIQGG